MGKNSSIFIKIIIKDLKLCCLLFFIKGPTPVLPTKNNSLSMMLKWVNLEYVLVNLQILKQSR